jgi:cytochrome c peroxidase
MKQRRIGAMLASLGLALVLPLGTAKAQEATATATVPVAERILRLPEVTFNYSKIDWPAHFKNGVRRFDNTPSSNRITDAGATLGRVLFYDTRVSTNNTVACASCHAQKNGFADPRRFSKGHGGKETDRHAPSLANVRFYSRGKFFWDERAGSLEEQVLMPIQSKVEMGQDLTTLVTVLGSEPVYADLFQKAFGDPTISKERVAKALAQFVRSLVSYQSKFDEGRAKVDSIRESFPNFTAQENRGRSLFVNQCARCHLPDGQEAGFFMNQTRSNGLDLNLSTADGGVGDVTFNRGQIGKFKSPSLRNVAVTGPYMHDGRFTTLEQVIDHYSSGVKNHPNVDGRLRRRLNLSSQQKADLVVFLRTLTDEQFLTDPKFSNPFQTSNP